MKAKQETKTVDIDLKWTLWTTDLSIWGEYAKGIIKLARDAFAGRSGSLELRSAPRKEIRYGTVKIYKGGADVKFDAVWDDLPSLASTLLWERDKHENHTGAQLGAATSWLGDFMDMNGSCDCPPYVEWGVEVIGARVERSIKARTFGELLRLVDKAENDLLTQEEENSKGMREAFCDSEWGCKS